MRVPVSPIQREGLASWVFHRDSDAVVSAILDLDGQSGAQARVPGILGND